MTRGMNFATGNLFVEEMCAFTFCFFSPKKVILGKSQKITTKFQFFFLSEVGNTLDKFVIT